MNKHAKTIKNRLESIIKDITENSHLYVKNPEKDFTRNRKLSFEEVFKILLSIGGNRGLAPEQVKNSHKKFFTCSRAWYKRLFSCF